MEYTLNDKWILYLQYKDLGTNYNENLQKLIEHVKQFHDEHKDYIFLLRIHRLQEMSTLLELLHQ